jgi:hypothetical protein
MSARALAAGSFALAAESTVSTDHPALEGSAAEIKFRGDLWRAYRLEAINAGLSAAQATEYANAVSSEMGLLAGLSETAPVRHGWFYQSRPRVVRRTITSGRITLTRWEKTKTTGRTAAARPATLADAFRWWIAGRKI